MSSLSKDECKKFLEKLRKKKGKEKDNLRERLRLQNERKERNKKYWESIRIKECKRFNEEIDRQNVNEAEKFESGLWYVKRDKRKGFARRFAV